MLKNALPIKQSAKLLNKRKQPVKPITFHFQEATMLQTISNSNVFHTAIPELPMSKYAHIVISRRTDSYPLFQTDGELNLVRVSVGLASANQAPMTRIVIFKRKQSTPERLTGRELLRRYNVIAATEAEAGQNGGKHCEYNSADFCKECPDCILYGFAIGNQGSERSKVMADSAFSLTGYDESHQQATFNGPFETGTMIKSNGETKTALGEQDHVLPQVFFPSVITLKDPTEAGFVYVLNNILRTKRYGAQNTRTGTVDNTVIGIVFADGEVFSNLKLTQKVTDLLQERKQFVSPLLDVHVNQAVADAIPPLLAEDGVVSQLYSGETLSKLLAEVNDIISTEDKLAKLIQQITLEARQYAENFGVLSSKKK
jgi:CRISPR-associated protein Csc2